MKIITWTPLSFTTCLRRRELCWSYFLTHDLITQRYHANNKQQAEEKVYLPKIKCIVARKLAEAEVNSKILEFAKTTGWQIELRPREQQVQDSHWPVQLCVAFCSQHAMQKRRWTKDTAGAVAWSFAVVYSLKDMLPHRDWNSFEWKKLVNKVGCQHCCSKCKGDMESS